MIASRKVSATEDGVRLSRWIMRYYPGSNKILIRRLCRSGEIRVNSKRSKIEDVLRSGDLIRIPPAIANLKKPKRNFQKIDFSLADLEKLRKAIIYNDNDIVIFHKPSGLAVQGGSSIKKSLDKMAIALFPNDTVLLVHRLDKETSGIIVVAKNQNAAQKLAMDFQSKNIHKEYIALLSGKIKSKEGIIDEPIAGKKAITHYKVIGELKNYLTIVRFRPETGRKHQLRIHSAKVLGAPIVGDDLYGSRRIDGRVKTFLSLHHLYLFASKISFRHPKTGKILTINAIMPEWMKPAITLCEM